MKYADRIDRIRASAGVTGIDFVAVDPDQTTLHIHFVRDPSTMTTSFDDVTPEPSAISIVSTDGGEGVPVVAVLGVATEASGSRLVVHTATPGDFSLYRLSIDDPRVDLLFRSVTFSFKAPCPEKNLDCKPVAEPCADDPSVDFPVDYMARDFLSLRGVLLDYAAQRYPQWQETIEADEGVMLLELLAALGDELGYTQDRIAREAYLATATQRRSVRRHGHLVDYNLHDGRSASTWLDFTVAGDDPVVVTAGRRVWAVADDGTEVPFELGAGLLSNLSHFATYAAWNAIAPYPDLDPELSLPVGATELFLADDGSIPDPDAWKGKWVLLQSDPGDPAVPRRRHLVQVVALEPDTDPLAEGGPQALHRMIWDHAQALPWCLDLDGLTVHANLVPAVAGTRVFEELEIRGADPVPQAVEREGPQNSLTAGRSVVFRHSLRATEASGLGWLGSDLRTTTPEIVVSQGHTRWTWRRTLLDSTDLDLHYTLEDGTWRRVIGFQRPTIEQDFVHTDYAADAGYTLRFGADGFGITPAEGTHFHVVYRTNPGTAANLAAGTVTFLRHPTTHETDFGAQIPAYPPVPDPPPPAIVAVTNPLPITDAVDPETLEEARQIAPEEFRAVTHRAVAPVDYCTIAGRLDWVQQAGARFRWTGSWQTGFVTPDPVGAYTVTDAQHTELTDLMNCVRQAGREVHVLGPRFRAIDVEVTVCVAPGHLPSEVRDRVLIRLRGDGRTPGYFAVDTFTFGMPIQRLTLEAVIGGVPGVLGVRSILIAARGVHLPRELEPVYRVPDNQILRLANDPRTPERGSIKVHTEGGV